MPNKDGKGQMAKEASKCTCPKCGHKVDHKRGVPCTKSKCPKCGATMKGENC